MRQQRVDAVAPAMDQVEHAVRHAGFLKRLRQQDGGERDFCARLEYERIATRQGQWKHPQRDHRWKIERGDADANAEGLKERLTIDAAGEVRQRVTEKQ